jgi:DNA-binding LacI/PurR family transcriptional regulator
MAAQAVEMLIQFIQQVETTPRQIILQPQLVVRASCGCAPKLPAVDQNIQ